MSLRVKVILISVFLCLALGATVFAAIETYHDFQALQQQNAYAANADVRSISPWMTIPYIAHFYHVPETYLYQTLRISGTQLPRHTPLHVLAAHYNRSVTNYINTIENAIQIYRKQHPSKHQTTAPRHVPSNGKVPSVQKRFRSSGHVAIKADGERVVA
ncbi:MAG TPA: hypothetical protein VGN15_03225 [Ktedonobacteraceae bacterium]|nr:hypothetical protein [Ktedonobacteraceae bacterium]